MCLFSDGHECSAPLDGLIATGRGRGNLHRNGSLLVGDLVEVCYEDSAFSVLEGKIVPATDGTGLTIERILPRKNALIRPPMANLDLLFVTFSAASPMPQTETIDKLIAIAEFHDIEPVIVVTKSDLANETANALANVYRHAGFTTFRTGTGAEEDETQSLKAYLQTSLNDGTGKVAAFSGASGVGKSSLLNRLFPQLGLRTGEISHRIERGKNTTRSVELYPVSAQNACGYIADTPGFTMLDFERFDFFDKEDLPMTFREWIPYIGTCRYTKCSHTKEEGCAVLDAVRRGEIAPSRHRSFVALYETLKKKTKW